ncbi:DUF3577 domain-containing protein [Janthinobacterium sp. MDT1-19]|uniref:DUF3577 domain-containing protein n=1 Tax=Janthinobacterium sp. MDT1-19 TaxID=1259339 RepID=UPI003F23982F
MMTNNSRNNSSKTTGSARQSEQEKAPEPSGYFDLHTKGCGYMNRIRWVAPKGSGRKAEQFLACAINALHGKIADPHYSYLDLRVSGQEAIDLVSDLMADCDADRKIFVAFTVGDIYAHTYIRDIKEHGRKTGEQEAAAVIKGRLLLITHIAIDDVVVFQRDREERTDDLSAGVHGGQDAGDVDRRDDDGQADEQHNPLDGAMPDGPAGSVRPFPSRIGGVARQLARDSRNVPEPAFRSSSRGRV